MATHPGLNNGSLPHYRLLLTKYLRVACLVLSLMSLVFSSTSYSTNRWSVSASDLTVDKFNLPLTFADRHTKDSECRTKLCRVLDERKDTLLVGRIFRGLTSVCEMVQRRTGETLILTCSRTDDNFIDVNVIRRLQLSAVVISTLTILISGWLLALGLYRPMSSGNKRILCGTSIRKFPVIKVGECTLILQITSVVLYLLCSLLLAMGSVMYVSNKQTEEVVSYSFFFSTVAFANHLIAALAAGTDFFICAALNNRAHRQYPASDYPHHPTDSGSSSVSPNSTDVGNSSTFSTLGIGFRPIAFTKPSANAVPIANSAPSQPPHNARNLGANNNANNGTNNNNNNNNNTNFEPPPFASCLRYHD